MLFSESRHNVYAWIFVICVFIACCAVKLWIPWVFLASLTLILLLVDIIFLSQEEYANSAAYNEWKRLDTSRLHEFEFDSGSKNKKMLFNE